MAIPPSELVAQTGSKTSAAWPRSVGVNATVERSPIPSQDFSPCECWREGYPRHCRPSPFRGGDVRSPPRGDRG